MYLTKKKKGFTLIELMAVIAIIAILAVVLVPTVNGYLDRAKKTAFITQIRSTVNAVEVYNSTAPDDDKLPDDVKISDLITPITGGSVGAFQKQDLLNEEDVSKLNYDLTYSKLKEINNDQNSMNNIYKDKTDKIFYYQGGNINSPVKIER